jgi:hypothetical protein
LQNYSLHFFQQTTDKDLFQALGMSGSGTSPLQGGVDIIRVSLRVMENI